MKPKVYIILPVHNRINTTESFIRCLIAQDYKNYQLILIDDGSTDGTCDMVLSYIPSATIIKGDGSLWWGGSLHEGYKYIKSINPSKDDYVLIINDDTEFDSNFLANGLSVIKNKNRTLLQAQSFDKNTSKLTGTGIKVNWFKLKFDKASSNEEINCLSTRGLLLNATDFISLGGFHPFLLPHYASDYEFTIKAYKRGYELMTDPVFFLYADFEQTGLHSINEKSIFRYFKTLFLKKSVMNPIYWITFILLSSPGFKKISSLVIFGLGTLKNISSSLARILNNHIKTIIFNILIAIKHKLTEIKFSLAVKSDIKKLVIGSDGICQPGWIASEQYFLDMLQIKDWNKYFKENSIDAILVEHVWEHLTTDQAMVSARNCFKYLKPDGYMRIAVPDGNFPNEDYINNVKPGGTGAGALDHKELYTADSLTKIFQNAGFEVKLLEYFDEAGLFHYEDWSPETGMIHRSKRFDKRNKDSLVYTSIILDAVKPEEISNEKNNL